MENLMKVCSKCEVEFEKNSNNFFEKTEKYKLVNGSFKYFKKLTALCKKCHGIKNTERKRIKKIKEYGCSLEDYDKTWKKRIGEKQYKIPEAFNSPHYRMILHNIKKGYAFTSLKQYEEDKQNNIFFRKACKEKTKLKYEGDKLIIELPKEESAKLRREYANNSLPHAVIANRLNLKLSECSDEMIERQKLIIQINQILNNSKYVKSTK